jgi:hypothetical protein
MNRLIPWQARLLKRFDDCSSFSFESILDVEILSRLRLNGAVRSDPQVSVSKLGELSVHQEGPRPDKQKAAWYAQHHRSCSLSYHPDSLAADWGAWLSAIRRQVDHIRRRMGTSATALASLYTRYMQHRLGTRRDEPCDRLMMVLPNVSKPGLRLVTAPTRLYKRGYQCHGRALEVRYRQHFACKRAGCRTR